MITGALVNGDSSLQGNIVIDKQSGTVLTLNTGNKYIEKPIELNLDVVEGEITVPSKTYTPYVSIDWDPDEAKIHAYLDREYAVAPQVTTPGYIDSVDSGTVTVNASSTFTIAHRGADTYVPSKYDEVISSGVFLTGDQTIQGDDNLDAVNIKSGVSIFGVNGTYTKDATATASDIMAGKTAYVNGTKVSGTLEVATMDEFKTYLGLA